MRHGDIEQTVMGTANDVPLLDVRGVYKRFSGLVANQNVSLSIAPGEIHALLGENGAGKTTLVKIIYGLLSADSGELRWRGNPMKIAGPADARRLGVGMVFQHFSLFNSMSVLENVALAMTKRVKMAPLRETIISISQRYGLPIDPDRKVYTLSVGERQRIEIIRCLLQKPSLLILDEPTSVLTPGETRELFSTLRKLRTEGCAILYITHKLAEIRELCQIATILRHGEVAARCNPKEETPSTLSKMMIGETPIIPRRTCHVTAKEPKIVVKGLSQISHDSDGKGLEDISFSICRGQIFGIAGLAGNGQQELMRVLTGEVRLTNLPETIWIDTLPVSHLGPSERRAMGIGFVPEQRLGYGAVSELSIVDNSFLTANSRSGLSSRGWLNRAAIRKFATRIVERFDVRTSDIGLEAGSLSGGNLQKFIVGREIIQKPGVLLIHQPTWGVDAGAAAAIHQAILDLADQGCAVLLISQDLDELFLLSDCIAVINGGKLSQPVSISEMSVEVVGQLMGDGWENPPFNMDSKLNGGANVEA